MSKSCRKIFDERIDSHFVKTTENPFGKWIFDASDLAEIKKMVDQNNNFMNVPVSERWAYAFRMAIHDIDSGERRSTLLDRILFALFSGDEFMATSLFLSDNALNLIELAKYLIAQGATINAENIAIYKRLYPQYVMNQYKNTMYLASQWEKYPGKQLDALKRQLEIFKKMFQELDPIVEKLIPSLREDLRKAQQERATIEKDEGAYAAQRQDKDDRKKFLREKIGWFEVVWRRNTGKWDDIEEPYFRWNNANFDEPEKNAEWDEKEYKQWLENGKKFNFGFESQAGQRKQAAPPRYQGKAIWDLLPGVNADSSKKNIAQAYRKFMKENHPDVLKDRPEVEKKEREEKAKLVNASWDEYNEQLKSQQSAKE